MSSANTGLVVPVAIWGNTAPSHKITCLVQIPQHRLIVTGSQSGQLVVWCMSSDMQIHPRSMLFGHTDPILCLAEVSETNDTHYVVSASEKELCLWNVLEGTCVEMIHSPLVHTHFQRIVTMSGRHAQPRLLCSGRYSDLLVLNPFTFEVCLALQSRVQPDWVSSFAVVQLLAANIVDQDQIVLATTRLGKLRIWTIPPGAGASSTQGIQGMCLNETETKELHGIEDVRCIVSCPFNPRTVLVVSPRRFFVLDASDLAQLCVQESPEASSWVGADFVSGDRCIVWCSNGDSHLFQLPASADPDSSTYRQPSSSTQPTLYAILSHDLNPDQSSSLVKDVEPVFAFETLSETREERRRTVTNDAAVSAASAKRMASAVLLRGDASGQLICWRISADLLYLAPPPPARRTLPDSDSAAPSQATRAGPRVPLIGSNHHTSLSLVWHQSRPTGIIDHFTDSICNDCQQIHTVNGDSCSQTDRRDSMVDGIEIKVARTESIDSGSWLKDNDETSDDDLKSKSHQPRQRPVVTTSIYLGPTSQLVLGRSDGSFVVTSLMHALDREILEYSCGDAGSQSSAGSHCCECSLVRAAHAKAVTCFIYPAAVAPERYEPHSLLSGGADFSVVLWDVRTFVRQLQITAHGGSVSRFVLAPGAAGGRLANCVASIANDNSVVVINLRERRILLSATAHNAPVAALKWRPLDSLLLVQTEDGAVYVWDLQSAVLDRVLHGAAGQDALDAADFYEQLVAADHQRVMATALQPATTTGSTASSGDTSLLAGISLVQAFKRKNLQLVKSVAQQRLQSFQSQIASATASDNSTTVFTSPGSQSLFNLADVKSQSVTLQGLRTSPFDSEFHVAYFDVEAIIVQLLADEVLSKQTTFGGVGLPRNVTTSATLTSAHTAGLNRIITTPNGMLEDDMAREQKRAGKNQSSSFGAYGSSVEMRSDSQASRPRNASTLVKSDEQRTPIDEDEAVATAAAEKQTLDIARLVVSLLHVRGLDPALDELVEKRLQLAIPKLHRLAFGHVSHERCLCLLLPGWWNALATGDKQDSDAVALPAHTTNGSAKPMASIKPETDKYELETISLARWQVATTITTQHLLSILAITNTMISLARVHLTETISVNYNMRMAFDKSHTNPQNNKEPRTPQSDVDGDFQGSQPEWAGAADPNEAVLNERQANVRQAWSVMAAYHCALLPDLVSKRGVYKAPNLSVLIQRWQDRCVEIRAASQSLVLNELGRLGPEGRRRELEHWLLFVPAYVTSQFSGAGLVQQPPAEIDLQFDESFDSALFTRLCAVNAFETRRRHATSIVVLGVLTAEFGSEFEHLRLQMGTTGCVIETPGVSNSAQGASFPLSALACRALTYILLQAGANRVPVYSPIRKCSVDLLGRGFMHFEPYVDVTAILFALLDLASLYDESVLTPFVQTGLPLVPAADLCRTARHALGLITLAKPSVFIVTLAKEVARYNALQLSQAGAAMTAAAAAAGSPQVGDAGSHPYLNILLRANTKRLVLRMLQRLIERSPAEVFNLIIETIDIVLFSVEPTSLKGRSLLDLFPAIDRFNRSLAMCTQSRRIAVGSRHGQLAIYSLNRQLKIQTVAAHGGALSALAFSADGGRLLATYSHVDNKVLVWQCPMPTLFGIGQSHLKCVKTFHITPLNLEVAVRNQLCTLPASFAHALHSNRIALSLLASDAQLLAHVRLARLLWLDARSLSLATSDGHEHKLKI